MEEVVKANKEKAVVEKREKERLRQQQAASTVSGGNLSLSYGSGGGSSGVGGMHIGGGSDGDLALAMAGGSRAHLDPPKDRNQLANMRVIRRNLVYGVGLPPSIATEEMLRRSEYFGQYGKVSKIVLNRNHNGNGDPRRASASAYVTFAHKDDTLACILALDGYYLDGRNIRASYGTSKYCSAFIKNVRCNNPDCTYLHTMGDSEDTFTKQEIQAGYVTSGRDVLARQQQMAAAGNSSNSRRRVGSGGPSGSGKVTSNPVFPPPTYDEPNKPSQANLVPPPPSTSSTTQFPPVGSVSVSRSNSGNFSSAASGNGTAGRNPRSSSLPPSSGLGSNTIASVLSTGSNQKVEAALTPAELLSRQQEQLRKMHPQNNLGGKNGQVGSSASVASGQKKQGSIPDNLPVSNGIERQLSLPIVRPQSNNLAPATAASVVAGVHSTTRVGHIQPSSHSTLSALTPLKRANSMTERKESTTSIGNIKSASNIESGQLPPNMPVPKGLPEAEQNAFMQRKVALSAMRQQQLSAIKNAGNAGNIPSNQPMVSTNSSPTSSISSHSGAPVANIRSPASESGIIGAGAIGGTVIGGNLTNTGSGPIGSRSSTGLSSMGSMGSMGNNVDTKNNLFLARNSTAIGGPALSIGGAGLGCRTISGFGVSNNELHGGSIDRNSLHEWPMGQGLNSGENGSLFGGNPGSRIGGAGLWGNESAGRHPHPSSGYSHGESKANSGVIGGSRFSENPSLDQPGALGSGFLTSDPFKGGKESGSSTLASMLGIELPTGVGSLRDSLWASSTPVRAPPGEMSHNVPTPTPIGAGIKTNNSVIIGGGTHLNTGGLPIGGYGASVGSPKGNTSDIALLQSLLPGVHITSGNAYQPAAPNTGRNAPHRGGGWGSMPGMQPSSLGQQLQHNNVQPVGMGGLMQQNIHPQQQQQQQQRPNETWGSGALYPGAPNSQHVNDSRNQNHSTPSNIW